MMVRVKIGQITGHVYVGPNERMVPKAVLDLLDKLAWIGFDVSTFENAVDLSACMHDNWLSDFLHNEIPANEYPYVYEAALDPSVVSPTRNNTKPVSQDDSGFDPSKYEDPYEAEEALRKREKELEGMGLQRWESFNEYQGRGASRHVTLRSIIAQDNAQDYDGPGKSVGEIYELLSHLEDLGFTLERGTLKYLLNMLRSGGGMFSELSGYALDFIGHMSDGDLAEMTTSVHLRIPFGVSKDDWIENKATTHVFMPSKGEGVDGSTGKPVLRAPTKPSPAPIKQAPVRPIVQKPMSGPVTPAQPVPAQPVSSPAPPVQMTSIAPSIAPPSMQSVPTPSVTEPEKPVTDEDWTMADQLGQNAPPALLARLRKAMKDKCAGITQDQLGDDTIHVPYGEHTGVTAPIQGTDNTTSVKGGMYIINNQTNEIGLIIAKDADGKYLIVMGFPSREPAAWDIKPDAFTILHRPKPVSTPASTPASQRPPAPGAPPRPPKPVRQVPEPTSPVAPVSDDVKLPGWDQFSGADDGGVTSADWQTIQANPANTRIRKKTKDHLHRYTQYLDQETMPDGVNHVPHGESSGIKICDVQGTNMYVARGGDFVVNKSFRPHKEGVVIGSVPDQNVLLVITFPDREVVAWKVHPDWRLMGREWSNNPQGDLVQYSQSQAAKIANVSMLRISQMAQQVQQGDYIIPPNGQPTDASQVLEVMPDGKIMTQDQSGQKVMQDQNQQFEVVKQQDGGMGPTPTQGTTGVGGTGGPNMNQPK